MTMDNVPALNAVLNTIATILITIGFIAIKQKKVTIHRACMGSAFLVSILFLVGYVSHKIYVHGVHTPFNGEGFIRKIYFPMLISHIILAMAIVPLVLTTLTLALKEKFERHRAWAKWTFPIWYYVSITGVLIYLFNYQWYPA
jgi:putative membrane protein